MQIIKYQKIKYIEDLFHFNLNNLNNNNLILIQILIIIMKKELNYLFLEEKIYQKILNQFKFVDHMINGMLDIL